MASERDDHIKKIMDKGAGRSRAASGSRAVASGSGRGAVGTKTAGSRASSAGATRGVAAERVTRVVRGSDSTTVTPALSKPSATRASAKVAGSVAAKSASAAKAGQKADKKAGVNSSNYPDRNVWISLVLLFVAGFLAICCASYLVYWSSDQDTVGFSKVFSGSGAATENWGGPLGSTIANYVMGEWFGVFGLMLPLAVLIASIQVLRIPSLRLRMGVTSMLVLMLVGSVAMGHFFGVNTHAMGSGLGGGLGIMSAEWLNGVLGYWGTSLLVVLSGVGYTYFAAWPRMRVMMGRYRVWRDARRVRVAQRREFERVRRQEQMAKMAASRAEALERAAAAAARHKVIVGGDTNADNTAGSHSDSQVDGHSDSHTETQLRERLASSAVHIPAHSDVEVGPVAEAVSSVVSSAVSADAYSDSSAESLSSAVVEAPSFAGSYAPQPPFVVELEDGFYGYFMGYDAAGDAIVYRWMGGRGIASYSGSYTDSSVSSTASTGRYDSRVMQDDDDIEFTVRTRVEAVDSIELVADTSSHNTSTYTANYVPDYMDSPVVYAAAAAAAAAAVVVEDKFVVEQAPQELQLEDHVINRTELYDPTLELGRYVKPPIELMDNHTRKVTVTDAELLENKNRIVNTLENFGIKIDTIEATIGPTVTLYEIIPAPGVRISKIKNLEDDIALALSALGIRIIAPIPGRGTIGIEVPNKDKEIVSMYSVIKSARFQESKAELPIAMGKTIENETFVLDLAKMPHLLVAGATGQGKSVGLNAIITSLLYKKHPAELKFILVDPKKVELTLYSRLEKHFLAKLPDAEEAIITDTQKVIYTLNSICVEMDARYDLLKMAKVRNIKEYNEKFINRVLNPNKGHRFLPYFVVIVDEFADLIMTAGREVETPIARIAQLARAVGIHLIIATQRPTTNIITGVIKANFPARIAFRVTSMIDSRTILDSPGANQLVGKGDMLISTGSEVTRVQCAFIDTPEVERIAEHIGAQQGYGTAYLLPEYVPEGEASSSSFDDSGKRDSLFEEVARYVVANDNGSASTIQRKFSIGFNRAGRLVDQLEAVGIVGRSEGSKPRQVLITDMSSLEFLLSDMN